MNENSDDDRDVSDKIKQVINDVLVGTIPEEDLYNRVSLVTRRHFLYYMPTSNLVVIFGFLVTSILAYLVLGLPGVVFNLSAHAALGLWASWWLAKNTARRFAAGELKAQKEKRLSDLGFDSR